MREGLHIEELLIVQIGEQLPCSRYVEQHDAGRCFSPTPALLQVESSAPNFALKQRKATELSSVSSDSGRFATNSGGGVDLEARPRLRVPCTGHLASRHRLRARTVRTIYAY